MPADGLTVPEPIIKISGTPLDKDTMLDLVDVIVDTDFFMPAMLTIRIKDELDTNSESLKYGDKETFKLGAEIKVSFSTELYNSEMKGDLFIGEITAIEQTFSDNGNAYLNIRAYDRGYRLMQGKTSRTFGTGDSNKSIKTVDVVSKITGENGFACENASESTSYTYLIQYNETDWDFLWKLARMVGFQIYVEESKFYFRPLNEERTRSSYGGGGSEVEVDWGQALTSFEPRINILGQVNEVSTNSWNDQKVVNKAVSTSTNNSLVPKIGFTGTGPQEIKKAARKSVTEPDIYHNLMTADQLKKAAESEMGYRESTFIQGDGYCAIGDPRIRAGKKLKISNVGKRFSGTYTVTKATHTWRSGLYTVRFSVSGSTPHTAQALVQSGDSQPNRIHGFVRAKVTDNNDPDKLGRVKVCYPWISNETQSGWARVVSAGAGQDRGFFMLPEINDEVLVGFEFGDLSAPFIVGNLWNKVDKPPKVKGEYVSGGKVDQRFLQTRSGHMIFLNDKQGEEEIIIQDKTKENSLVINSTKNTFTMKSKGDFTIETQGNFIVKATGDVTMDAKGNNKITCARAFSVDAKQEASLTSTSEKLALKPGATQLAGAKVDIKSNSMLGVSGTAMVEIKGALVKIN